MRTVLTHPIAAAALASLLGLTFACGRSPEPSTPSSEVSVPSVGADAATTPPSEPVKADPVVARVKSREIRAAEVERRVASVHTGGGKLEYGTVRDAVDDLIDETLLAEEARAAGFKGPEGADDSALAEAWATTKFSEAAKASIGEAELTRWFAERRGLARIAVRSSEQARDVRASLAEAIKADPSKARETFLAIKQKVGAKGESFPDGVLIDAEGMNELGEAVAPVEVAKVLFSLNENGEVAEPVAVGESFVIVQRVGLRPGTPLAGVPETERQAALDKLIAARALSTSEEHLARLRRDVGVEVVQAELDALATRLGATKTSKLRKLPFGARKIVMQKLRNGIESRSPALVPPGAHTAEKAAYDQVKEKMQPREPKGATGGQP